jgi:hypothetical protein
MIPPSQYSSYKANFLAWMARDGTDVIMTWVTLTGVTTDYALGVQTGVPTVHTETVKGMVHFPQVAIRNVERFAEIEVGDILVDLPPTVTIEGRDGLEFTIDGARWTQKKVGAELAKHFEIVHENSRLCRTLLLSKAT